MSATAAAFLACIAFMAGVAAVVYALIVGRAQPEPGRRT